MSKETDFVGFLQDRVNVGAARLVAARQASSHAAMIYVQSVGMDQYNRGSLSPETLDLARQYLAVLNEEAAAFDAYRMGVRRVIADGEEWQAQHGIITPTRN